jgi:type VI secretion system secreted protein Hcp
MASDMYIKFDGIDGEVQTKDHEKEVAVLSWSHQFSIATKADRSGPGGGTVDGKCNHGDFSFAKYLDAATDDLLMNVWFGKHIDTVTFTAHRAAGGTKVEYLKIEMKGVVVSSYSISGGEGDLPTENVSLSYEELTYTYTDSDPETGKAKGAQPANVKLSDGTSSS